MRLGEALTPLRDRRFAWYYAGRFSSLMGGVMVTVALPFAVLDLTGDDVTALGQVLAARSVPMVLFMLVGGVIADRLSRSTVLQVSHLVSAVTQGLVAALLLTGTAELWMVIALEAVNGFVTAFAFPAMFGIVPQVAPRSHLQQANALLGFSRNAMAIIGPTVAALLVVTVGPGWALAIDSAALAVAAFCMYRVHLPPRPRTGEATGSMVRELKEGWTEFASRTWVWVVVLAFGLINAIAAGAWFTLGPALAKETVGERGWGLALSMEALGLLLLTLVLLKFSFRRPLRAGMLGTATLGLPILVLGVSPDLAPLVAAAFLAGCGIEVFGIGWNTAMHEHIPENVLSRVSSYDALGSFVAMPVGQLVYGPLAGVFEIRSVMVVSGLLVVAIALATLLSRSVRDLERAPAPEAVSGPTAAPAR